MTLSCEQCVELLGAHVEHALEPERRADMDAHLRDCSACRQAFEDYQRIPAVVRRATEVVMPTLGKARLRRMLGMARRRRAR